MRKQVKGKILETAVIQVSKKIDSKYCASWQDHDEYNLWTELVACILGSRVSYEQAKGSLQHLDRLGLLKIGTGDQFFNNYEEKLVNGLWTPVKIETSAGSMIRRYPFPKQKANHIARTARNIYSETTLKNMLQEIQTPEMARIAVMSRAVGIGPKQASLFLRNIGYCDKMAVLDMHVLRYLFFIGLLRMQIKSIPNLFKYEQLEEKFRAYAKSISVPVTTLDIAIWVVMRVYQKEFAL